MVGCRDRQNWQSIFAFCRRTGHQQTIATPTRSKRWREVAARHTLTITAVRSLACTRMLHIHLRNLPRDQGVGYGGRPTLVWSAVSPTQKSKKLARTNLRSPHTSQRWVDARRGTVSPRERVEDRRAATLCTLHNSPGMVSCGRPLDTLHCNPAVEKRTLLIESVKFRAQKNVHRKF